MTLQLIKDNWYRLIPTSRKYRSALPDLLAWVKPNRLEGSNLVLSLNNPLLRLDLEDNREPLQNALLEVFGYPFSIEIEMESK